MRFRLAAAAVFLLAAVVPAWAQPAPTSQDYVPRADFDKLKNDFEQYKKENKQSTTDLQQQADDTDKVVKSIQDDVNKLHGGSEEFIIAGDGSVGFTTQRGTKSTFGALVSPLLLWSPDPRILVESAFDLALNPDGSSSVNVGLADISFIVNDNLIVGGGLFTVPFGAYHSHFDPPWINKFVDAPLVFSDGGLAPSSLTGVYARGAVPLAHDQKLTYDVYLVNGPSLITDDPGAAGSLNFSDNQDVKNAKAAGGRIGYLPAPNIEMGYSVMYGLVNPDNFPDTYALLQCVDINWRQDVDAIAGALDVRAEYVLSNVQKKTYDPTGTLGFGPVRFNNVRSGGYVQICYRPTKVPGKFIKNLEFCARFDTIQQTLSAPGGTRESRLALGVDYWLTPFVVFQTEYEIDTKNPGPGANAFYAQVGFGL